MYLVYVGQSKEWMMNYGLLGVSAICCQWHGMSGIHRQLLLWKYLHHSHNT